MRMIRPFALLLMPALLVAGPIAIGLTVDGHAIEATEYRNDGPTIVVVCATAAACKVNAGGSHVFTIHAPAPLIFPPTGVAYREHPESHHIWRWLGVTAPDLVVILGKDESGLAKALAENAPAGVGHIPVRTSMPAAREKLPLSEAHQEMDRRLARSPRDLARLLAQVYGHDLPEAVYIPAMALIGRLRLGDIADVERIVAPYRDGTKDSVAKLTSSHFAGHLVFGELAERTKNPRYVEMVRRAADLAATEQALYSEMSDGVFMGCPILAKAGKLSGDRKYFDLALHHLEYMQKLCLRSDGIYRNSPLCDAAWGRGNAFPALGLALALSDIPRGDAAFAPMLRSFQAHMAALVRFQNEEGMWRQVVDVPGAYSEFSATAMIGTAMHRGIANGWLDAKTYQAPVDRAWRAVLKRTADNGVLIDVCEGTGKQKTLEDYLHRAAILDRDARGGGMAIYFATEMGGLAR